MNLQANDFEATAERRCVTLANPLGEATGRSNMDLVMGLTSWQ
jgi:hypothetical protein